MASNIYYIMDALGWNPGFFCSYQSAIGFLNFCEKEQPAGFQIFFEKGLYFDNNVGPNWWEYYFEPVKCGEIKEDMIIDHIGDMLKSHWGTETISTMSRERAAEIIHKYIKVKPNIQNKIDDFIQNKFNNSYIIGIHYRGTDKSSEAPRVAFDVVRDEIKKHLNNRNDCKIFIATDEQSFLNYMISQFSNKVIYINAIRSAGHEPIHHINGGMSNYNRYILGEDAVIDCYLLSKTNIMIRTQSNLSSSAANINPNLPVIDLNHAHYRTGLR
jgi:Nodulation protein Z (NodZ)